MTARRGVSVVVCSYTEDRWDDICGALDSVRNQLTAVDELIVVVDYAPDLAARLGAETTGATVVENTSERGLSGARNSGIAAATAEIVAFLDDDAVAEPDWLDRLCEPYADPAVVAVGGRVEPHWDNARPPWFPPEFDWVVGCTYAGHPGEGPIRNVIGANMSFRREVFAAVGGFDDRMGRVGTLPSGCEETELCIRVRQQQPGAVVWYAPSAVVHHRVRPERATLAYFRSRCVAEGGSKTRVARLVGAQDGLASERSYATRTLPLAAARDLRVAMGNAVDAGPDTPRRGALARVAMRASGVAFTSAGFAGTRVAMARTARAEPIERAAFRPALVGHIDLSAPGDLEGGTSISGAPYERAFLLVRDHGRPCGTLEVDLPAGGLTEQEVKERLRDAIEQRDVVIVPRDEAPVSISTPWMETKTPRVTVVVATCNRPEQLQRCVESILANDYPEFDVLVVDNTATSSAASGVGIEYPPGHAVAWTWEETPGLACAHNRALREVTAPIVAFTDDDVVVDPHWISRLVAGFGVAPDVGCVTGMIFPLELETSAQALVEEAVGFNKGFETRLFRDELANDDPLFPYAAGRFGSGANMAFRTDALRALGGFDTALGTGTRARGGDDLAAFFDIVSAGHALVYEPAAVVFHAHRRDDAALARQAFGYGAGLTAYLTKTIVNRPTRVFEIAGRLPAGLRYALAPSSAKNARLPDNYSRSLVVRERAGMLAGPALYVASRHATRHLRRVPRTAQSRRSHVVSEGVVE